ncbi:MAG TPA: hypothetical protein VIY49_13940 [Bryobacteraceae bacterium]
MSFHRYTVLLSGALLMAASALAEDVYDKIVVDLPANTWVGGEQLAAGKYEMRQLPSPGLGSNVILVNVKTHRKISASAISERALKNIPFQHTHVTLLRIGTDYYLDHIWIAGKEFGYKFPVPKEPQEPEALTLTATYSTPPPVVAEAAPPPPPPAPPAPEAAPPPPPPAEQPAPEAAPPPPPPAPELPHTASNWPLELAGALVCLAIGLTMGMLRRLRS